MKIIFLGNFGFKIYFKNDVKYFFHYPIIINSKNTNK